MPWLLVWDDHEVENDYAGLQGEHLEPDFKSQRAAAYRAYWEHMPLPKAARPVNGEMRMYGRLDWGQLARIHLPTRQITNCAFGGPELRTLFISSARFGLSPEQLLAEPLAGGVFAVETDVRGRPAGTFGY